MVILLYNLWVRTYGYIDPKVYWYQSYIVQFYYWKFNFPMNPYVRLFGWLVDPLVVLKIARSYTSMLLSEHLIDDILCRKEAACTLPPTPSTRWCRLDPSTCHPTPQSPAALASRRTRASTCPDRRSGGEKIEERI